jgi:hypothetical protein
MAMVKPIALTVNAFDATIAQTFYFTASGGNQIVKNKITIRNNETNTVVYTNTVESYSLSQTVPANTLTNGLYYNYSFVTYDVNNNESAESNIVPFYCYTTPILTFTNIPSNKTISTGSYSFDVQYVQNEGELVDYIYIILYDSSENIISQSDNIYSTSTPPFTVSQIFSGLENNVSYYIRAYGVTINGTEFSSDKMSFTVIIETPEVFSTLTLTDKCSDGYTQVQSYVTLSDGESNGTVEYINNNTEAYLPSSQYVEWTQGFSIGTSWLIKIFMSLYQINDFVEIGKDLNGNEYKIKWIREIPYVDNSSSEYWITTYDGNPLLTYDGQNLLEYVFSDPKDCFELIGYSGKEEKVLLKSNYVDLMNNTSNVLCWLKKVDNTYTLKLTVLSQSNNVWYWGANSSNNVVWNRITNLQYNNESYAKGLSFTEISNNMDSVYPLTIIKIYNGIYDHLDITKDATIDYNTDIPSWTYNTVLDCSFNENIFGGNISILLDKLQSMLIKRREKGSTKWITLKSIPISSYDDLSNITYQDSFIKSGATYQWALVPLLKSGIEGTYITTDYKTITRNGVFISDGDTIFKLYNGVMYGQNAQNNRIGILQPIGLAYPIVNQNGKVNYASGSLAGNIYGYNFEDTRTISRSDVVEETNDLIEFLNNGSSKIICDWNGNIKLIKESGVPTTDFVQVYGNGVTLVTFPWVEQGKYNSQSDLYNNGLISVAT